MTGYRRSTLLAIALALIAAGSASAGQAPPPHLVTFFLDPGGICPAGWTEMTKARGRLVMATTDKQRAGRQWGAPLRPGEPQLHSHATTYKLSSARPRPGQLKYAEGPAGMLFDQAWQKEPRRGTSGESALALPYMQMLLC